MKRLLPLFLLFLSINQTFAQVTLNVSPYQENFNNLSNGLPAGFSVRNTASATTVGTEPAFTATPGTTTAWSNTTVGFKNFASAAAGAATSSTAQNTVSDRALGLRQTSAAGYDPGAAFVFQVSNTQGKSAFKLSFDLQSLDASSPRSTTWQVQYATGATPSSFTNIAAGGTLTTGGSTFSNNAINVDFGNALDNKTEPVWIRIVNLSASTGSGNRASTAIDNFSLSFSSASTTPVIGVNPNTINFPNQNVGTQSASQSYTLNGSNLTSAVSVNTSAPFSIAKDNVNFATSLTLSQTEIATSPLVYVRYSPIQAGNSTGTISQSSAGAADVLVNLSGNALGTQLSVDQSSFDFGTVNSGTNAPAKSFNLTATGLSSDVNLNTNTPFSLSKDNINFSSSITYTATELANPAQVYVRFSPTSGNTSTENISITASGAATQSIALSGTGSVVTATGKVVISEVYGGGGNAGSVLRNDFIELYNPGTSAINLNGWSVQYASAAGTAWQVTPLSGSIAPKSFYLVQEAAGTGGTTNLPTPDAVGTINMAGAAGKVLLANVNTAQAGTKPTGTAIVDLVGFGTTANGFEGTGPAPAPSNTFSIERKASATSTAITLGTGGTEEFAGNGFDNDNNVNDFVSKVANPQNSSITEPVSTSGPFLATNPNTLSFGNQAINTGSVAKTYQLSAGNLTGNTTVSTAAPYSISKDNVTFGNNLSYTTAELASNQTVYVKFNPTQAGNATGAITHASAGAATITLALSGAGIDPNQTVFNFENCTTVGSSALSDGFYQYSVSGPQTWGCTSFGHDANDATGTASAGNAFQINGFASGNILNEDWLISPALNLSSFNFAILSFWSRSAFAGDKLQLKISTNYAGSGDPNLATWTNLDGKFPETASDKWTKSDNIDLTAYKATPVYVAIVYNSTTTSASRWTVDDFAVNNASTPPAVDIIPSPSSINFGYQAANTSSDAKAFNFSAANLTGDVTVNAPSNFTIAKTNTGTYSSSLTFARNDINNTSPAVFVKFSPVAVNTNYSGNINISSNGSADKTVALSGNTFDIANTLEVVNWNIEWFGSPAQDPANDPLQAQNVKTVVNNINADIYGFAEAVDTTLFRNTVLPAGYQVIFSEFGSYADDKNDPDYPLAQKLAFMYRTDIIKPISTFGVLRDTYNPANPATSADGTPYKNWSSGRFPFLMQAQVKINNKIDTVYFIEVHAKANTGTTADQIDSYNRRKDGNKQLKTWIDANLAGKKVIILGDFNDVLNPDKTIAPLPAGTGTSYSDFTQDTANYFPVTLPLSFAGKQSTVSFQTVIDNVILSAALNKNYIPASAEVLDGVKNLVTNYGNTTTDHYPIKTRYLFGNGAPTLNPIADQKICFTTENQSINISGISAGPENNQSTTLAVLADQPNLFDVLRIAPDGTDKAIITYRLKNNASASSKITVTVTDNGGTDFDGVNEIKKSFTLNEFATPSISISSNKGLSLSKGDQLILTANAEGNQFNWTGLDILNGQGTANLTIRPKKSGTYQVTVTNANGCSSSQRIDITVIDDYKLEGSTVLTPNGDGFNDKFIIKNIDYYPNNTLKIFDKAGRILYNKQSYANDWDGMVNGSPLAEGTYYYIVDLGNGIGTYKGYINIIRN